MTFHDRIVLVAGKNPFSWATNKGISKPTMNSLLHATRPQQRSLKMLEQKTGIPVEWWLNGEGPPPGAACQGLPPAEEPVQAIEATQEQPAPIPRRKFDKINVGALAAIIQGALIAAPDASPLEIARHTAKVYDMAMEDGLITPDGIGDGHLDMAA